KVLEALRRSWKPLETLDASIHGRLLKLGLLRVVNISLIVECLSKADLLETKCRTKDPYRDKSVTSGIRASQFKATVNKTQKNGASGSAVVGENQGRDDARQHLKKRGTSKDVVASLDKRVAGVETSMMELKTSVRDMFMDEITKIWTKFGEEVSKLHHTTKDLQVDVAL
ncbi:hypothetical protein Tco_1460864, partial [Tanacetum coccineum]